MGNRFRLKAGFSAVLIGAMPSLMLAVVFLVPLTAHVVRAEVDSTKRGASLNAPEKWWTCAMHPKIHVERPGKCPLCRMELIPAPPRDVDSAERGTWHDEAVKWWTCSMHPQIRQQRFGHCPICGMELIPVVAAEEETISVPEGKLREFCEERIERAVARMKEREQGEAFIVLRAYVQGAGKEVLPRLRKLLTSPDLNYVSAAAYELGKLNDREAVPQLKKLLESKRLAFPPAGESVRMEVFSARFSVAGALYQMEQPEGLQALLKMRKGWAGIHAYAGLALRDTKEAREVLAQGAQDKHPVARAYALAALLELGEKEHLEDIVEFLESEDGQVRFTAVASLSRAALPETQGALVSFLSRDDVPQYQKVAVAAGLVRMGKKEYLRFIVDSLENPERHGIPGHEMQSLGELGGEEHLPVLRAAIENDRYSRTRAAAAALMIMRRSEKDAQSDRPGGEGRSGSP